MGCNELSTLGSSLSSIDEIWLVPGKGTSVVGLGRDIWPRSVLLGKEELGRLLMLSLCMIITEMLTLFSLQVCLKVHSSMFVKFVPSQWHDSVFNPFSWGRPIEKRNRTASVVSVCDGRCHRFKTKTLSFSRSNNTRSMNHDTYLPYLLQASDWNPAYFRPELVCSSLLHRFVVHCRCKGVWSVSYYVTLSNYHCWPVNTPNMYLCNTTRIGGMACITVGIGMWFEPLISCLNSCQWWQKQSRKLAGFQGNRATQRACHAKLWNIWRVLREHRDPPEDKEASFFFFCLSWNLIEIVHGVWPQSPHIV